jgi:hypothetical protein
MQTFIFVYKIYIYICIYIKQLPCACMVTYLIARKWIILKFISYEFCKNRHNENHIFLRGVSELLA